MKALKPIKSSISKGPSSSSNGLYGIYNPSTGATHGSGHTYSGNTGATGATGFPGKSRIEILMDLIKFHEDLNGIIIPPDEFVKMSESERTQIKRDLKIDRLLNKNYII